MSNTPGTSVLRHIRRLVAAQCPSQQSDMQLLQQFIAERDEEAFAALVQRHGGMVLAVCRGVLHHQQDAEDVFQATFLVLARRADTIRNHDSVGSWLHGVAYRLALKMKSQANRRREREASNDDPFAPSLMDDLTMRELRGILHEELSRLTEQYRAALLLCYWEGKTRDEAAEQLGMTAGAFKKCLERARDLLGSRLIRRGLVPSAALFSTLFCDSAVKAALPGALIQTTAQTAVAYVIGSGVFPNAAAVALANGAIRAMNLTKWITTFLVMLFVSALGTGLGYAAYQRFPIDGPQLAAQPVAAEPTRPLLVKAKVKKTDKDRIVGTWRITKGIADGEEMPAELTLFRVTFAKDGNMSMVVVDRVNKGKYELTGQGEIDFGPDTIGFGNEPSLALYRFDGDDRLTLCVEHGGKKRPTKLAAEKGEPRILFIMKRAKPGEEKASPEEIAKHKEALDHIREAAARTMSANNLKQIGLAMHNWQDQHKEFPAHAIYSKDSKTPLLSWRVKILPFIDQNALFKEFKLDEPWDSEHNKKLIAKMPKIYVHPLKAGKEGETYYQVFTGPDTPFAGAKMIKIQQITDGTSATILAVEAKDPVIWTKPADLTMPKDKDKLPAMGGQFKNGFNALFFDGSVRFVSSTVTAAQFRTFVTPSGNDEIMDK